jgi:hypothetical protein
MGEHIFFFCIRGLIPSPMAVSGFQPCHRRICSVPIRGGIVQRAPTPSLLCLPMFHTLGAVPCSRPTRFRASPMFFFSCNRAVCELGTVHAFGNWQSTLRETCHSTHIQYAHAGCAAPRSMHGCHCRCPCHIGAAPKPCRPQHHGHCPSAAGLPPSCALAFAISFPERGFLIRRSTERVRVVPWTGGPIVHLHGGAGRGGDRRGAAGKEGPSRAVRPLGGWTRLPATAPRAATCRSLLHTTTTAHLPVAVLRKLSSGHPRDMHTAATPEGISARRGGHAHLHGSTFLFLTARHCCCLFAVCSTTSSAPHRSVLSLHMVPSPNHLPLPGPAVRSILPGSLAEFSRISPRHRPSPSHRETTSRATERNKTSRAPRRPPVRPGPGICSCLTSVPVPVDFVQTASVAVCVLCTPPRARAVSRAQLGLNFEGTRARGGLENRVSRAGAGGQEPPHAPSCACSVGGQSAEQ